jgi:hypothetical protein
MGLVERFPLTEYDGYISSFQPAFQGRKTEDAKRMVLVFCPSSINDTTYAVTRVLATRACGSMVLDSLLCAFFPAQREKRTHLETKYRFSEGKMPTA